MSLTHPAPCPAVWGTKGVPDTFLWRTPACVATATVCKSSSGLPPVCSGPYSFLLELSGWLQGQKGSWNNKHQINLYRISIFSLLSSTGLKSLSMDVCGHCIAYHVNDTRIKYGVDNPVSLQLFYICRIIIDTYFVTYWKFDIVNGHYIHTSVHFHTIF